MKKLISTLLFLFLSFFLNYSSLKSQDLYGLSYKGGLGSNGCIYKTDSTGNNLRIIHSFGYSIPTGSNPLYSTFCLAKNGKMYGLTKYSIIFYDPNADTVSWLYGFSYPKLPEASLIQASDNKFYGIAGGAYYPSGTIFSFDPDSNKYEELVIMKDTMGSGSNGNLIEGNPGVLLGMSCSGGKYNSGLIFSYNIFTKKFNKLYSFVNDSTGHNPYGTLVKGGSGLFYGVTHDGGKNDYGTIFSFDTTNNSLKTLFEFDSTNYGYHSYGNILFANDGLLYIPASKGGKNNAGTIITYDTVSGEVNKIADFENATLGSYPRGGLCQAGNGKIYGVTSSGGINNKGVIYCYDIINKTIERKFDLSTVNGQTCQSTFIMGLDEKLYTMTMYGGTDNKGIIFSYNTVNDEIKNRFNLATKIIDKSSNPFGSLYQADNGILYGVVTNDSKADSGKIFSYDISKAKYSELYSIDNKYKFSSSLIQGEDGLLYGYAQNSSHSTKIKDYIYSFDPVTNKFSIVTYTPGLAVKCNYKLIFAEKRILYVMVQADGIANSVLYYYNFDNPKYIQKKVWGYLAVNSFFKIKSDLFFGATWGGYKFMETSHLPYLFSYDYDDNIYVEDTNVLNSSSTATLGTDSLIYGTYSLPSSIASIYSYDIKTKVYKERYIFPDSIGKSILGEMVQGWNGKLYGITSTGGANNKGTIFSFNPAKDTVIKKYDIKTTNDILPNNQNNLIMIYNFYFVNQPINDTTCTGKLSSFCVKVNRSNVTFQWQCDSGAGFNDINDNSTFSGCKDDTIQITNITYEMNEWKFRCKVFSLDINRSIYSMPSILYTHTYIINNDTTICSNSNPILLRAIPNGGVFCCNTDSNLFYPANAGEGSHLITYQQNTSNGCIYKDSINILVNLIPDISFADVPDSVCVNNSISLIVNPTGGTFSGATTTDTFNAPAIPGTYPIYYSYEDLNGCSNNDSIKIKVSLCPPIRFLTSYINEIYPNPAIDYVIIKNEGNKPRNIQVLDMLNRKVMEQYLIGERVNIETLSPGIYFLKVDGAVYKLIKQ